MEKDKNGRIEIRRIWIRNYKGIDELKIDFPSPRMSYDHDIFVMGSINGMGKTSIIECCALLLLTLSLDKEPIKYSEENVDVPDLLIRAGAEYAEISGTVTLDDRPAEASFTLRRNGMLMATNFNQDEKQDIEEIQNNNDSKSSRRYYTSNKKISELIRIICGFDPNPFVGDNILFFHSFRKVQVGNPELGSMVETERLARPRFGTRYEASAMSTFKLRILRSMMGSVGLFEGADDKKESETTINILNDLMTDYAKGVIEKLSPSSDNTVDFRVKPKNGNGSYTFDGLSSGQKEIVSTLFLIWYFTNNNPSVVFIDEPELHFNARWHRSFINKLLSIAPHNQYILATHSEDVMDSVDEAHQISLLD
jgi:AAA15 family ATPase/GTPase